jgi:DNA-binding NtrC family response regulator
LGQKLGIARYVNTKLNVLLADRDHGFRDLCKKTVEGFDCGFLLAADGRAVVDMIRYNDVCLVILDAHTIPDALEALREIKGISARIEVLIADERATIQAAVVAIKAGASDYLEKPLAPAPLETAISQALERYRNFQPSIPTFEALQRKAIQEAIAQAQGDKLEAARLLAIGKTTLYRKLREYGDARHYRPHRGPARKQPPRPSQLEASRE